MVRKVPEHAPGFDLCQVELHGTLELLYRFGESTVFGRRTAEVRQKNGLMRIELERPTIARTGFLEPSAAFEHNSEVRGD